VVIYIRAVITKCRRA